MLKILKTFVIFEMPSQIIIANIAEIGSTLFYIMHLQSMLSLQHLIADNKITKENCFAENM